MIPIPPYIPSWSPVPVVTPFTYRDGITMLKKVDGIIRYLNRTIVPFINESNQELADKVEADINNMINVVNIAIENIESETDIKLAAMEQDVNDAIQYVNTSIANLTSYVDDQVQLIISDAIEVQDPVIKGIMQDDNSQTRSVTDTLYAPFDNVFKRLHTISVLDYGAKTDVAVDSSAGIQAAIDYMANLVKTSSFATSGIVVVPGGRYRLDAQIKQPAFVKVVANGNVILETHVPNDSAWRITPDASDSANPIPGIMDKQQWNWGNLLSGNGGAFHFANMTGTRASTTALELGSRTDIGPFKLLSRYELSDVSIQEYDKAIQWNSINNYINTFSRFNIENCNTCVWYGTGVRVTNSGEKVTWNDSLFASNAAGFAAHEVTCDTINLQFFNCSFDYLSCVLRYGAVSGYSRADFFGGHIESINNGATYHVNGGIVVSGNVAGVRPEVGFVNVPYVVGAKKTQFKGKINLRAVMDFRSSQLVEADYADGYLCDDNVRVLKWSAAQWESDINVSRTLNLIGDSLFTGVAAGTDFGAIPGWTKGTTVGVTGSVVDAPDIPYANAKALALVFPAASYTRLTKTGTIPVKPGNKITLTAAVKLSDNINIGVQPAIQWKDIDGNVISTTVRTNLAYGTSKNKFIWPINNTDDYAPKGAVSATIMFDFTGGAGSNSNPQLITDLFAIID